MDGFAIATFCARIFEARVRACMDGGLVRGEGFAVDASVMEAALRQPLSRQGAGGDRVGGARTPDARQLKENLAGLDVHAQPNPDRKVPKVTRPAIPARRGRPRPGSGWGSGHGLDDLIDLENAVIVDVEPTPARTYDEVGAQRRPCSIAPNVVCVSSPNGLRPIPPMGPVAFWAGPVDQRIVPHIPVRDASERDSMHVIMQRLSLVSAARRSTSARTGRRLTLTGTVHEGTMLRYRASELRPRSGSAQNAVLSQ